MSNIYRRDDSGGLILVQRDTDNQVDTNTEDIASLNTKVSAIESTVSGNYTTLNTKINSNTSKITSLDSSVTSLSQSLTSNVNSLQTQINNLDSSTDTSITSLKSRVTDLETDTASLNANSVVYKTLTSINSVAGTFTFDNKSGINTDELPSGIVSHDWTGVQFGMKSGGDKTQIIFDGSSMYYRYSDANLGSETWTNESWTHYNMLDFISKTEVNEELASVVHTTDNETIAGTKTFTNIPVVYKNSPAIYLKEDTFVTGTSPSTNQYWSVVFHDANGAIHSRILHYVNADGYTGTVLDTKSVDGTITSKIAAEVAPDGRTYATAPTPSDANANNTMIATTAWVTKKVSNYQSLDSSACYHNGIYRGKNLTSVYSMDALSTKIQANDFSDLYIGDYIEVSMTSTYATETVRWLFAGFDCFLHKGDTELKSHHIVLVPDDCFTTTQQMNDTNTTEGGYANSAMHTTVLPNYATALQESFGSHITSFKTLLSNSVSTSLSSIAGAGWSGASNGWAWTDAYCRLLSEIEVYGSTALSSSLYDIGDANNQLPLFRLCPDKMVCGGGFNSTSRWSWWLKAVASSASFACVTNYGNSASDLASGLHGVRPLILFI